MLLYFFISVFVVGLLLIGFFPKKSARGFYRFATKTEARFYGLKIYQVKLSELSLSIYRTPIKDRPTIVMLHGFSAEKNIWSRFARYFTSDFNVIIPDLAGHGATEFSKNLSYSVSAQIKRVNELLDQLGIEQCHIIGNSMGGFFSAHFALAYPERTLSACLVNPAGVKSPIYSNMDNMVKAGKNPFLVNNRQEFNNFYKMTMAKPPWLPSFVYGVLSDEYQRQQKQLTQMFLDFYNQDQLDNELINIKPSVLILWGREDELIHVSSVEVWMHGLNNVQTKIWDGIGHMPMFEIPKESAEVYKAFLEKL